ncbi:hypothetical protein A5676_16655 [Mycobacterium malmoense]|uniref:Uncharacterized protein n=1 Tax=Mycobacterium malmoense TaxID=1780 RepID=A0A1B9DE78_MYCMA|nr:hypothetical protein A5676_16655 [Mycobacterium malmoense]OCB62969.1 hypothetical protein A5677_10965 [Mycobacterium malmoense]
MCGPIGPFFQFFPIIGAEVQPAILPVGFLIWSDAYGIREIAPQLVMADNLRESVIGGLAANMYSHHVRFLLA